MHVYVVKFNTETASQADEMTEDLTGIRVLPVLLLNVYAMRTYGGSGSIVSRITWMLDGGEWSASRPGHFTPGEKDSGTH
jgi:hypothetical protein